MNTLAIEINDAELVIADQTGVHGKEPGYAALISGSIVTGMDAYSQVTYVGIFASLQPRVRGILSRNRLYDHRGMPESKRSLDSFWSAEMEADMRYRIEW